jgi:pimeloyl-ACP methyl ester carboxylesterase
VEIAYQISGDGEFPLIFVHGWCCDKSYWREQVSFFEKRYKIITIDLAGHGESGINREKYTIPLFANDVSAVINQLGLKDFIIIGHSMGVNVMLEAAIQNPDKTRALFSIDGYREIPKIKTKEELVELEEQQRAGWSEDVFESKVYNWVRNWQHRPEETEMMEKIAKDMSQNNPRVGIESLINMMQWYFSEYPNSLKKIENLSVISIASESKPNVEEFRNYGVNLQDFRMDGYSHFFHITQPEKFNKILDEQISLVLSDYRK